MAKRRHRPKAIKRRHRRLTDESPLLNEYRMPLKQPPQGERTPGVSIEVPYSCCLDYYGVEGRRAGGYSGVSGTVGV